MVEEESVKNEINKDIYYLWYSIYSTEILNLKLEIEWLGNDQGKAFIVLEAILNLLADMIQVYITAYTYKREDL